MEKNEFSVLFSTIFHNNKLERLADEGTVTTFFDFTELFTAENARTNLSAIREVPDIICKHYADCLLAESEFPRGASVLDVGCGGGFPTFPLAIARPDLKITAVDSTGKKISFVENTAKSLRLTNIRAICGRIEEKEFLPMRETFDVVTSRAVAAMPILSELTLPFLKIGGVLVALKGAQGGEELKKSLRAIEILGGKVEKDTEIPLKTTAGEESRHLLTIRKVKSTPSTYPRAYAQILKKPL